MRASSLPVAPLGNRFGELPRRAVPAGLENSLFAPGAQVYAILDAGRIPMFDAEILAQGQPFACLFSGDAIAKLGASAPWIFQLSPDSRLTRRLFTLAEGGKGYWSLRGSVFLRSTQDLAALRGHFRRFTQIADEVGKRYFLRFYCPDALPVVLDRLAADPDRLQRWFRHRDSDVVDSYWVPDADAGRMIVYRPDHASLAAANRVRFMLDPVYREILRDVRRIQQRRQIAQAVLLSEGNAGNLSAQDWYGIVNASVDAGWQAGIGPERALAYLAMAGLGRGRSLTAEEIIRILQMPASPGEQTERARHFAATAAGLPERQHDGMTSR